MLFQETRDFLEKIGLPKGDLFDLPTSEKSFLMERTFVLKYPPLILPKHEILY